MAIISATTVLCRRFQVYVCVWATVTDLWMDGWLVRTYHSARAAFRFDEKIISIQSHFLQCDELGLHFHTLNSCANCYSKGSAVDIIDN